MLIGWQVIFFCLFPNKFFMLLHFYHEKTVLVCLVGNTGRLSQRSSEASRNVSPNPLHSLRGQGAAGSATFLREDWHCLLPEPQGRSPGQRWAGEGGREGIQQAGGRFILTLASVDTTRAASRLCGFLRGEAETRHCRATACVRVRSPASSVPPGLPRGPSHCSRSLPAQVSGKESRCGSHSARPAPAPSPGPAWKKLG